MNVYGDLIFKAFSQASQKVIGFVVPVHKLRQAGGTKKVLHEYKSLQSLPPVVTGGMHVPYKGIIPAAP